MTNRKIYSFQFILGNANVGIRKTYFCLVQKGELALVVEKPDI